MFDINIDPTSEEQGIFNNWSAFNSFKFSEIMMLEKEITVKNKLGIHARPAALLVKNAGMYQSKIEIKRDDLTVDGKSIMGVMMLAAEQGAKLLFSIEGDDADKAMEAIEKLFEENFYEE